MSNKINDEVKLKFNPVTGQFDTVVKFNPKRIVSHEYNMAGTRNMIYDPASRTYVEMGAQIVTDDEGNVIVIGN